MPLLKTMHNNQQAKKPKVFVQITINHLVDRSVGWSVGQYPSKKPIPITVVPHVA